MKTEKVQPLTKRDAIIRFLQENPSAKQAEIIEHLKGLGFEKIGSSEISCARQLARKSVPQPITVTELEQVCLMPAALGYTASETLAICEVVRDYAAGVGGMNRLIDALQTLKKFQGGGK